MGAQVLAHVTKFDVGIQPAAQVDEVVAVLDRACRVRDQDTDSRVSL
jgi:hypothetical protein